MEKKDPTPLMDEAYAWSFEKKYEGRALTSETLAVQNRYRAKLRQAQRFVLDDETVKLVCHLSHEVDRFDGWAFLARLPYSTLWIEFDLHTKVREFANMGTLHDPFNPAHVARQLGLLLYRDDDSATGARWVCHEVYDFGNAPSAFDWRGERPGVVTPKIVAGMLAYVFDPEGDPMWPVKGSKAWAAPTLSLMPGFPKVPVSVGAKGSTERILTTCDPELVLCGLFGTVPDTIEAHRDPDGTIHPEEEVLHAPGWFASRSAVILDPWWRAFLAKRLANDDRERKRAYDLILQQANELRGAMRWVVTLLAAINALPRAVKPLATRPGKRTLGMSLQPYLTHNHLSIELPRDNRIVWARKRLDHESGLARRKWHRVMGHWRVVDRGKRVTHLCRHVPTMVENGLGMCIRCEMLVRWIADHVRGDITLGQVEHTHYEVTARRQDPWKPRV